MIEHAFSIFGVVSSLILIPSCFRLWRRKTSNDFSIITIILGIICQSCWLFYSYYYHLTALKSACLAWLTLLILQLILILVYRKNT